MEDKAALSIEESIQRLKAEIIAQDWRLSPNRANRLDAAFACLRQRFKSRKATHAMLIMAGSVLDYIRKKGGTPPETIDFLKEAMAHVVSLYEELIYDPEKEEIIFQKLFSRFTHLKKKIKQKKSGPTAMPLPVDEVQSLPDTAGYPVAAGSSPFAVPLSTSDNTDIEHLINDLKSALEKAGKIGSAIEQVLEDFREKHQSPKTAPPENHDERPVTVTPEPVAEPVPEEAAKTKPVFPPKVQSCPPTELKELVVNGRSIAIQADTISLIRTVKPSRMAVYIKQSNVPLKDLSSFFGSLSRQFVGTLSQVHNSKLKQLKLPIMNPESSDWPDTPDNKASHIVVVSSGNWHGIIPCSSVRSPKENMIKFEKQKNGDIAGFAHLDNGQLIELLDLQRILHREGFLVMI